MNNQRYPVAAPVFDGSDHNPAIIGQAATAIGAMRHYRRYFANTTAPAVVGVEKCQPELASRGPVDGWQPVFAAD